MTASEDIPLATVNLIGPSEFTAFAVAVSGVLLSLFGHDWGVGDNASAFGVIAAALASAVMSVARANKHAAAAAANAKVLTARLYAAPQTDPDYPLGRPQPLVQPTVATVQQGGPAVVRPRVRGEHGRFVKNNPEG